MKGPAIFLAQFAGDVAPFNTLDSITKWVAGLGYKGVQIPSWDTRFIDLKLAAESQDYVDEIKGVCAHNGVEVSELASHLQGQLVATHPAFDTQFDGFAPAALHGKPAERQQWAVEQVKLAARASRRFGLKNHATFSGALMWHMFYPWPQRPAGLVEAGFAELGRRWKPILDVFEDEGVNACYELHPGEDLHDGVTFERFLEAVDNHPRANILYDPSHFLLQQLDYLAFIDIYHDRIKAFHVKDAEFRPNGRAGVYGSYSNWVERPGRFRSLGDGQIDFGGIFSKFTQYGYDGWAVLEWECALKHPEQGAAEGAPFIARHMIRKAEKAFDDFAGTGADDAIIRGALGLSAT
ncbi:sugar phosphate isomerase/epimerase family protein [Sphingobium boeckii]|uniref:Sugar phosphate isomerase/epimerase n=1 Tax=Sphingobium boeckii TaxID=1082345 RepID=A0A7W9EE73_9SPHN|nr:sugar phosphate isomerase/epimerase family protein [Sphingobium boeckii]MBB5685968.1 sugar phosphate isomerase/epimerase [Sphingobium boeckii]